MKNRLEKCEYDGCNRIAEYVSRDVREIYPTRAADGVWWKNWEPASAWRYGCKEHIPAPSRTFYLPPNALTRYMAWIRENDIEILDGGKNTNED